MRRLEAGSPYCTHTRTGAYGTFMNGAPQPASPPKDMVNHCLVPFDRSEGITVEAAAEIADKSVRTMRLWCEQHQIGRRIGGGPWVVSRVALDMLLDGDDRALRAYLAGDRKSSAVLAYYERAGLSDLIRRWQKSVPAIPAIAT